MTVRADCRHYSSRSVPGGDLVQRCRVGANDEAPFACPEGCLFFESRAITDAGWLRLDRPGNTGPDADADPDQAP